MVGGTGNDIFHFDNLASIDQIADFSVADDTIQLVCTGAFTALPAGTLANSAFTTGTAATTAEHRIIYDNTGPNGKLFYDAEGSGSGGAVPFAEFVGVPVLTNLDFVAN